MKKSSSVFIMPVVLLMVIFSIKTQAQSVWGADSVKCVQNISLYEQYFKQKNYDESFDGWRWIFQNCPSSRKSMYINGITLYEHRIKTDAVNKDKYVDTLMMIYDQRIKYFGEEGFVTGRKAVDLFEYRPSKLDSVISLFRRSVEMQGINSEPTVVFRYFQAMTQQFRQKKATKEEVIDLYEKLVDIIEKNIETGVSKNNFEVAKENLEALFGPFATCEDLVGIYTPKYKATPNDTVLLKKILSLLSRKEGCTNNELYFDVSSSLHKVQPSVVSAIALARSNADRGKHQAASALYDEAIRLETDNNKKAEFYIELADLTVRQLKNAQEARSLAQKAIGLRPDWGKPYIFIGDIYVSNASSCQDAFSSNVVFWAAVDKYVKAKSVDPSVTEEANKKIATYSKYFPPKEDIFFQGFAEGQPYKIQCWINETTTVRIP